MIFDIDVIIWVQRGNKKAAKLIDNTNERYISIQSYMELLQCAPSKQEHFFIKDFLKGLNFRILSLTERIGHRAAIYVEEYSLAHGIRAGDAIIAATAVEHNLPLATSNKKHFQMISELDLRVFTISGK